MPKNTELENKQKETFFQIQNKGFNICTCGQCGAVLLMNEQEKTSEEFECFDCGFTGEQCDFPDFWF
ncbi:hypothetical protein JCM30760_26310 [Thiomicrorhabdus hydrogeniphila]